jgi:hypothetical protein
MSKETDIFDHKQIKKVNIDFNDGYWNAKTHYMIVTYNTDSPVGISAKLVPYYQETEITDVSLAESILNQFKIHK